MAQDRPDGITCPHCEQTPAKESWPLCSWCGLFLVSVDELDLSPAASLVVWRKEVQLTWLQ